MALRHIIFSYYVGQAVAQISSVMSCFAEGPSYGVSSTKDLFNSSLPLRVFADDSWQSSWTKVDERDATGADALGEYTAKECSYAVQSQPGVVVIVLSVFTYSKQPGGIIRFSYTLPHGLVSTSHSAGTGEKGLRRDYVFL